MVSRSKWHVIIGSVGSIASVIALWFNFVPDEKNLGAITQVTNVNGSNNISNNLGTINYHSVVTDTKNDVRTFKKFVPETYLKNLPRVKYNAYMEAHKYWDTGITSEMMEGTNVFYERLREMLIDLSATAYTEEFFEGKPISIYYDEQISRLMKAAYDSQPSEGGTMHLVMAHGELSEIADNFIVKIVKDVSDPSYFQIWEKKWMRASELGREGQYVDLDITSEF